MAGLDCLHNNQGITRIHWNRFDGLLLSETCGHFLMLILYDIKQGWLYIVDLDWNCWYFVGTDPLWEIVAEPQFSCLKSWFDQDCSVIWNIVNQSRLDRLSQWPNVSWKWSVVNGDVYNFLCFCPQSSQTRWADDGGRLMLRECPSNAVTVANCIFHWLGSSNNVVMMVFTLLSTFHRQPLSFSWLTW